MKMKCSASVQDDVQDETRMNTGLFRMFMMIWSSLYKEKTNISKSL